MIGPLVLALAFFAPPAPAQGSQPVPHAGPRSSAATRVERFVIEEVSEQGREAVALAVVRRVPVEGGLLLEQEMLFRAGGLRILIDELHEDGFVARTPRLVWRELRTGPGVGRTWLAEWDAERGAVLTSTHGMRRSVHRVLGGPEPTWPLELIEQLRAGARPTQVSTLDPLSRDRVTLQVQVSEAGTRRTAHLRRTDGSLAGRYVFDGDALVEFQWAAGTRVARPCDEREYRRLSADWTVRYDPLEELRATAHSLRARPR
jgi:hypothetical protein